MEYDGKMMQEIMQYVEAFDPFSFVVFFWMLLCVIVFMISGDDDR